MVSTRAASLTMPGGRSSVPLSRNPNVHASSGVVQPDLNDRTICSSSMHATVGNSRHLELRDQLGDRIGLDDLQMALGRRAESANRAPAWPRNRRRADATEPARRRTADNPWRRSTTHAGCAAGCHSSERMTVNRPVRATRPRSRGEPWRNDHRQSPGRRKREVMPQPQTCTNETRRALQPKRDLQTRLSGV